jgi:hypothetical protein
LGVKIGGIIGLLLGGGRKVGKGYSYLYDPKTMKGREFFL